MKYLCDELGIFNAPRQAKEFLMLVRPFSESTVYSETAYFTDTWDSLGPEKYSYAGMCSENS